ncbi:phospholipase D-like domain-containing protein [Nonomuraea ceibae]|uniref:phospholipase D-like domain-containing protein n=1 Tax=Nonomuraea ceibae TaxID=1935170 RepID=UPI001C5D2B47|nr:phospholipase D-like domain-containing protein [Nonomuraea ceibae]
MMSKRAAVLAALCLALPLTLSLPSSASADVTGPPVIGGPVFNDPVAGSGVPGTPSAAQSAVMDQLIRLIRAARPGSDIRFVMFEFGEGQRSSEVADALIDAHARGVRVKAILDSTDDGKNDSVLARLGAALGSAEGAASFVVQCEYPDPAAVDRGCIARNYLHSKFATFSELQVGGVTRADVVFQTSSNLSDWYLYNSYNDAYTFQDAVVHDAYVRYFDDLRAGRHRPVNPDYFWTTPTGTKHRGHFLPRDSATGDHIANVLKLVECSYRDTDGVTRQTDVRLVLTAFNWSRVEIARELLRLRGENCWVDVVYNDGSAVTTAIREELAKTVNGRRIQLTPCRFTVGGRSVVPHAKLMMIDGFYDDDITPRVYTGSANFTTLENADDSLLRISGRDVHTPYLSWFYKIRDTCRA